MIDSGLCSVCSHTDTHGDDWWSKQHLQEAFAADYLSSNDKLKEHLNIDNNSLCWPKGLVTKSLMAKAKDLGVVQQFTTVKGNNNATQVESGVFNRLNVTNVSGDVLCRSIRYCDSSLFRITFYPLYQLKSFLRAVRAFGVLTYYGRN
jgi:hypothetical protein